MGFLFFLTWTIYYVVKGVVIGKKSVSKSLNAATFIAGGLSFYIAANFDAGPVKYAILAFLAYSLTEQVAIRILKKPIPVLPGFSGINIQHRWFSVRYLTFKPIVYLCLSLIFWMGNRALTALSEERSFDVTTRDGTKINVKM
ncbi:MAG: hypothetical protein GY866_00140 [Proteobacteria bacterium]|nr:hypothetical protein [Pseudomonadota bacterium]